jgi:hypothetical protein
MMKTTAATVGQVQADRDKLSAKESLLLQCEAELGRRESTILEKDKEIEQRLSFAVNQAKQEAAAREVAEAHAARVEAAQSQVLRIQEEAQTQRDRLEEMMRRTNAEAGRSRILPEDRDIGHLMQMFPGTYRLGDLPQQSYIQLHNGEKIEGPEFQFHAARAFADVGRANRQWRFHNSGLEASEPDRQKMYEAIRTLLRNKMEDVDDAVRRFEEGNLGLQTLRQMAYLLTRKYDKFLPHMGWFMLMYRENRNARFRETQRTEPPPLEPINDMDDARNWAKTYYDRALKEQIGSAFWRDEWIKWEGGRIRDYAKMQGKTLNQAQREMDFRPSVMPDYMPQEFGQPRQIYEDEQRLRLWR